MREGAGEPPKLIVIDGGRGLDGLPLLPREPGWLSDAARAVWRRFALPLARRGVLGRRDGVSFGTLCELAAELRAISETLDRDCRINLEGRASGTAHPLAAREHELITQLSGWCRAFGLSPRAMRRLWLTLRRSPLPAAVGGERLPDSRGTSRLRRRGAALP